MKADSAQNQQETKQYKVFPILFAMLLSGFIGLFGETALNVALTPLMGLLEVGPTTIQWLTTGYLLVLGILVRYPVCCCNGLQPDSYSQRP